MNLKEAMLKEVDTVFLNLNEFASNYEIMSAGITVYIDGILSESEFENRLKRTATDYVEEASVHGARFTCASHQLKRQPAIGDEWTINGKHYFIENVEDRDGVHTVSLIKNIGR